MIPPSLLYSDQLAPVVFCFLESVRLFSPRPGIRQVFAIPVNIGNEKYDSAMDLQK